MNDAIDYKSLCHRFVRYVNSETSTNYIYFIASHAIYSTDVNPQRELTLFARRKWSKIRTNYLTASDVICFRCTSDNCSLDELYKKLAEFIISQQCLLTRIDNFPELELTLSINGY